MNIRPFKGITPVIGERVYIDPMAAVIGQVTIGDDASIWPMVAIRGDVNTITIGARTNIQDGSVLHVTADHPHIPGGYPLNIGDDVTVGHSAILHACTIGNQCLIGMGATVLDNSVIEDRVLIGAGSLVPPNKRLESGFLYLGNPVKKARPLTEGELQWLSYSAGHYVKLKDNYLE